MLHLIKRLRDMIGDDSGPAAVWTDERLQERLDERQTVVRYAPLEPHPTPQPGTGIVQYLDYYATAEAWEADAAVFGNAWQPLTPSAVDLIVGHWQFSTSTIPTVWLVGKNYDLNGTAADVLTAWAAKLARDYDFMVQDMRYYRSQQVKMMLELAAEYRAQSKPRSATMRRDDMAQGGGAW
jgi:hypothetical protein